MEFIVMAMILTTIASAIGYKSIINYECNEALEKPLYDEETLIIMRRYDLITEEQFNQMINSIKENI
ncbi:hypothetical protein [Clostridium sp. Ade.TY]|uniref:hypothetical protein n=1 Tax=Clostridium sp. Ade.TY TaxID=1391647 RepID=UPI0004274241|nr:hypothetical protein [Clostridium sp. Ade.TY]